MNTKIKLKAAPKNTAPNNRHGSYGLQASLRPNCQSFCGNTFVSVRLRPVSTPSLCSVGHSPQALGTPAQYKLATLPCLNVVSHACRKDNKDRARKYKEGNLNAI
jgi:hypothetical protein